ncbi:hypothetical protein QQZ08_009412 [Neonectria magnoliae]|uniref:Uncharacterized protein n=1 Tax=Neonectria magnoliae TaxID=2732573 RepID=A0ABR1HN82_9HYPO
MSSLLRSIWSRPKTLAPAKLDDSEYGSSDDSRTRCPPALGYWETMDWLGNPTSQTLDAILDARDEEEDAIACARRGLLSKLAGCCWQRTRPAHNNSNDSLCYEDCLAASFTLDDGPPKPLTSKSAFQIVLFAVSRISYAPERDIGDKWKLKAASCAAVRLMEVPSSPEDQEWLERVMPCLKDEWKTPKETWSARFPDEMVMALLGEHVARREVLTSSCSSSHTSPTVIDIGPSDKPSRTDSMKAVMNFSMVQD